MKKDLLQTKYLLIVLIALVVLGFTAVLLQNNSRQTSKSVSSILTKQTTKKPSSDSTEGWDIYKNERLGFTIEIPKYAISFNGGCKYETDGDDSYRPIFKEVPVQILENGNNVYLVASYFYKLLGKTEKESRAFFSSCIKTDITLDTILNTPQSEFLSPILKFTSRDVSNDQQLQQFIKDSYGKDCVLGSKTPVRQEGVFSVEVGGIVDIGDQTKDCLINYMYSIRYSPTKKSVVAWDFGQSCNFPYPEQGTCQDQRIADSFRFL